MRSFGQVLGITIGSTVFSNKFGDKLPEAFVSPFGNEVSGDAAYALAPQIAQLCVHSTSLALVPAVRARR